MLYKTLSVASLLLSTSSAFMGPGGGPSGPVIEAAPAALQPCGDPLSANPLGKSCLERINYYRQMACAKGWDECPEGGLPPMKVQECCHKCVNSEAEYDKANGAHASFERCGEQSQGEGGGSDCAAVIDMFVAERYQGDDGKYVCEGHCGPVLQEGCRTFSWGRSKSANSAGNFFYTLNWRTEDAADCSDYCGSHSDCFTHEESKMHDLALCVGGEEEAAAGMLAEVADLAEDAVEEAPKTETPVALYAGVGSAVMIVAAGLAACLKKRAKDGYKEVPSYGA